MKRDIERDMIVTQRDISAGQNGRETRDISRARPAFGRDVPMSRGGIIGTFHRDMDGGHSPDGDALRRPAVQGVGTPGRGLRTLDDLLARCWVDDITGCWRWRGGLTGQGLPSIWFPPLQARTTPGVILCWLTHGRRPNAGEVWHRTCDSLDCCSPKHRRVGNRHTQMVNAAIVRSPIERARIAAGRRKQSRLTQEAVDDIRSSTDRLVDCAARHGISISHVSRIRRGELRRELTMGASVFNLGDRA